MAPRTRSWIVVPLMACLAAGCGGEGGDDGGSFHPSEPTPVPTATGAPEIPCPHQITYTLVGEQSDLDLGWTGLFHDQSSGSGASLSFGLTCQAGASFGQCGDCYLQGPIPSTTIVDNHRCINASEIRCADDIPCPQVAGSPGCGYFFGPPLPLTGGGVPICVVNRMPSKVTGSVNPESGSGRSDLQVDFAIYTGDDPERPCPRCSGVALGDEGTCRGGRRDGADCTVDATNGAFGNTSFDCPPNPGAKIGSSLVPLDLTTGGSSMAPIAQCAVAGEPSQRCYCTGQERKNACNDGACVDDVEFGGEGSCVQGPVDHTCTLETFRSCSVDADCPKTNDSCTTRPRECLGETDPVGGLGPLVRLGLPSRTNPLLASVFCLDATSSAAVNAAVGLPGPGAVRLPTVACVKESCP